jgi:2C-methyl-D-erythritol 2,4-cyclodiphosphate synthase
LPRITQITTDAAGDVLLHDVCDTVTVRLSYNDAHEVYRQLKSKFERRPEPSETHEDE